MAKDRGPSGRKGPKIKGYHKTGWLVARKLSKYQEAGQRHRRRDTRSDAEQLLLLDERPGNSERERSRIAHRTS